MSMHIPCHVRETVNGPIIRTIPNLTRYHSAYALARILHDRGEFNLTVLKTRTGHAGLILTGKHSSGWYTTDLHWIFPYNLFGPNTLNESLSEDSK
jgi:hypothetical protein